MRYGKSYATEAGRRTISTRPTFAKLAEMHFDSSRLAIYYQAETKLPGQMLYYVLTTGSGQQTLLEEYCDMISVSLGTASHSMNLADQQSEGSDQSSSVRSSALSQSSAPREQISIISRWKHKLHQYWLRTVQRRPIDCQLGIEELIQSQPNVPLDKKTQKVEPAKDLSRFANETHWYEGYFQSDLMSSRPHSIEASTTVANKPDSQPPVLFNMIIRIICYNLMVPIIFSYRVLACSTAVA